MKIKHVAYRISYIIYVPNINEKVIIFYMLQLNFHGEKERGERERERGKDFSLSIVRLRIYVVAIHRIFAHKIDCEGFSLESESFIFAH